MKKKGNPNIFVIGFNENDSKHQQAVQILTKFAQRRRASSFIADAIDFYERFGGFEKVLESILMRGGGFEKVLESILMQGVKTPDKEVTAIFEPESVPHRIPSLRMNLKQRVNPNRKTSLRCI